MFCPTSRFDSEHIKSFFPIEFRRNEDFYLSSTITLNCNESFSTNFQWVINKCSLSACLNAVPVDPPLIITTTSEFFIPARTIPSGIDELKLIVTMNVSSNLRTIQSAFVRITSSGITVNLVQLGTSMISRRSSSQSGSLLCRMEFPHSSRCFDPHR